MKGGEVTFQYSLSFSSQGLDTAKPVFIVNDIPFEGTVQGKESVWICMYKVHIVFSLPRK